jgi:ribosomal protein L37AE/L43A
MLVIDRGCTKAGNRHGHTGAGGIVHDEDTEPRDGACPACGSSATYQTMDGRWGCTQCGSTWA